MEGYEISFNVYANSQEEANIASRAIKDFINAKARDGVAVTASKLAEAINKWRDNVFVTNYFKR